MRYFNTAGPCDPDKHYMVPAAARLADARRFVERGFYLVVHAPRQSGKTTTLRELSRALTAEGRFAALLFSCEAGEAAGDDIEMAQQSVLEDIRQSALRELPVDLRPPERWPAGPAGSLLTVSLADWASKCSRPLVLVFDEIDALRGDSLLSVLRQLRAGYQRRPDRFPHCVILCGLRDVRDYKMASGGDAARLGTASPFNIKVESVKLRSFGREQVASLYREHTLETGQEFDDAAVDMAFELTQGQPWLVNALAREVVEKMEVPLSVCISAAHVVEAKERLILARATHLDSLAARLTEPRVRRILEPVIAGSMEIGSSSGTDIAPYDDDRQYVADLGLVHGKSPLAIANPIYREVMVRVLSSAVEDRVVVEPRSFVLPGGTLDMDRLMAEFLEFWRENGDVLAAGMPYHEVAPQLVMMAFLQRVVNGGGYVEREYGIGRGRIDLLVKWPVVGGKAQREAVELKVWADGKADPLDKGLAQLDQYLRRLGLDHGYLVVFDRRTAAAPIEDRCVMSAVESPSGRKVMLLRG